MHTTQELIRLLKNLKNSEFSPESEYFKTICLAEKVLDCFFRIEVTKTELSLSERDIIGSLIADSLEAIGAWVSYSVDEIHEGTLENYKIERSGLQFLLEKYQQFPDGKGSRLEYAFEKFKATEDVEGWDKQFKSVNSSYDPNLFFKIPDEPTLTAQETEQLPASHWWW